MVLEAPIPPSLCRGTPLLAYEDSTLKIQSNHGRCDREFHHGCLCNRRVRLRALVFYQSLW